MNEENIDAKQNEYKPILSQDSIHKLEEAISAIIAKENKIGAIQIDLQLSQIDENNQIKDEILANPIGSYALINDIASRIARTKSYQNIVTTVHFSDITKPKTITTLLPQDVEQVVTLPLRVIQTEEVKLESNSTKKNKISDITPTQTIVCSDSCQNCQCKVILHKSMTGILNKGDSCLMTGIVKTEKNQNTFKCSLICLSFTIIADNRRSLYTISKRNIETVQKVSQTKPLLPSLVQSLCPNSGVSLLVKMSLLLSLFSNVQTHTLILGEYSNNIKNLFDFVCKIAPIKCVMTETSKPDDISLSSGGCLIVDSQQSLKKCQLQFIEAIETNKIRNDTFTDLKSDFSSIVFCQIDNSQKINLFDETLQLFTLSLFDDTNDTNRRQTLRQLTPSNSSFLNRVFQNWEDNDLTIEERLKPTYQIEAPFTEDELRVYISYVKSFVSPVLTENVKEKIENLSKMMKDERALQKLTDLSIVRTSIDLKEEVSEDDVDDVFELLQNSFDINQKVTKSRGKKLSKKNAVLCFMNSLRMTGERYFSKFDLKEIFERSCKNSSFNNCDEIIDFLSSEGTLLLCPDRRYRLSSSAL